MCQCDLLGSFNATASMSQQQNDSRSELDGDNAKKSKSQFCALYKYAGKLSGTQEERRRLLLQRQKEKRNQGFDEKRHLDELLDEEESELMECEAVSAKKCKGKKRDKIQFGYKQMEAEWLTDIPDDLAEQWFMKLCPEGIRYLVVAHKGVTTCYFRNGKFAFKMKTNFPGGNAENHPSAFTVIDCIYNKDVNTYFIYDCLAWGSMSLINAEAHMRFCWLRSKYDEDSSLGVARYPNTVKFVLMDFFPAQKELLQDLMLTPLVVNEAELPYEGVLFYHKEGHYVFGRSPLVGWLKSFMLNEVFHIDVPSLHLCKVPQNYTSLQNYIEGLKKDRKRHRNRNGSNNVSMEMEELENAECDSF